MIFLPSPPAHSYWTLGFADVALRLLGSDDFAPEVKLHAARELSAALVERKLVVPVAVRLSLAESAAAHEAVEHGAPGRVVVKI